MRTRYFISLIMIMMMVASHVQSQRLVATKPAYLQVFGKFLDGTDVTAETRSLKVTYETGLVKGELLLSDLVAMDIRIQEYLQKTEIDMVYFEVMVEQGAFSFGKSLEKRIQGEGEIIINDRRTRFIMDFLVTNRAQKGSNTFQIVGTAELSLAEHFNITAIEDMDDRISFQYTQNMEMMMQ